MLQTGMERQSMFFGIPFPLCNSISSGVLHINLIIPKEMVLNGKIVVFSIAAVMTSFYLFNYHRYKNRDEEIKEKYKDSKANKWFKLWMFPLIILLLYFLPFIVMGHTEYV